MPHNGWDDFWILSEGEEGVPDENFFSFIWGELLLPSRGMMGFVLFLSCGIGIGIGLDSDWGGGGGGFVFVFGGVFFLADLLVISSKMITTISSQNTHCSK